MTESARLDWLVDFEALAFFTADHAAVENNKLYVNGGFWNALRRDSFPARVVGSLAVVIKVPASAYQDNHHITVQLVDQDHDEESLPFRIDGEFRLGASPHLNRGDPSIVSLAFPLDGLVLERAGEYSFVLSIDEKELKRYRIHAIQSPPIHLPPNVPGGGDDEKEQPLNLDDFDAIDWDPEDDLDGNHAHCAEHSVDERVVDEVLGGNWVSIEIPVDTAEFAIVGPNAKGNVMWTLLFDTSWKRSDWLRPVTGWDSRPKDIREWERVMGEQWKGSGRGGRRRR